MVISTGESSRTASLTGKAAIGGVTDLSIRVALREDCCTEEGCGVLKRTTATRGNTGKTRNTGRVFTSGVTG
jgi:hypothetical protein